MRFKGHFDPMFHPNRLAEPSKLRSPARIFTVSMGDMFGDWVPDVWIEDIFKAVSKNPHHTFMVLTKNPRKAKEWSFPDNLWIGTTCESEEYCSRIDLLRECDAKIKFVSFEPLLGRASCNLDGIDWVIIGGQTNPDFTPQKGWVYEIIRECRIRKIPVFLKGNLHYPIKIEEFPDAI